MLATTRSRRSPGCSGRRCSRNGPETEGFEREFAAYHGAGDAVAFASGTVALIAMFRALGIGAGDEVVVPSLTFVSSATSVVFAGAKPVFADVDPDTFNLDPADVAGRLGPRAKAILAVHYGGQPADLAELTALSEAAGVHLLEDAAEAHGACYRGRHVGTWGLAGVFSFTPTKNITTGEGGMVTTDDLDLAQRLRLIRNHGQTPPTNTPSSDATGVSPKCKQPWAAARSPNSTPSWPARRSWQTSLTSDWLAVDGVRPPFVRSDRDHVHMLYTVKLDGARDVVMESLRRRGIETRVYFPPVHRQPIFAGTASNLPVTDDLFGRILSLPIHSKLTLSEVGEVAEAVADAVSEVGTRPA